MTNELWWYKGEIEVRLSPNPLISETMTFPEHAKARNAADAKTQMETKGRSTFPARFVRVKSIEPDMSVSEANRRNAEAEGRGNE